MKRNYKILIISALLAIAPLFMFAGGPGGPPGPPHPRPKPGNGHGGTPVGGAPIGNGTFILITLAAAYAIRKVYVARSAKEEITE